VEVIEETSDVKELEEDVRYVGEEDREDEWLEDEVELELEAEVELVECEELLELAITICWSVTPS
jgi:hypothetical protein